MLIKKYIFSFIFSIKIKLKCPHCAKDLVRLDKHFAFFHNLSASCFFYVNAFSYK